MENLPQIPVDLYVLSFGFWLIFGIYSIFSIKKFIAARYEKETDFLNTVYFQNHFTFVRYLPDFFSSGFYATHLMSCIWGWRIYGDKKIFKDIKDPEYITNKFSNKEKWKVKRTLLIGVVVIIYMVPYYICKLIWPEYFASP